MAWSDSINIGNYDSKDGEITAVTFQARAMRHKIVAYRYIQNARSCQSHSLRTMLVTSIEGRLENHVALA